MAEGNRILPLWQCDSITFNYVLLLLLPALPLSLSKTPRSFDLIRSCYYHQTTGENMIGKRNSGMIIGIWSMVSVCLCLCSVNLSLTSFSFCWGDGGSVSDNWTTVSQTCVWGPLAVSLNWTGSSRLAPSSWAKMDPSVRTLKTGSLLWKTTASFPMQSSNFTVEKEKWEDFNILFTTSHLISAIAAQRNSHNVHMCTQRQAHTH